MVNISKTKRNFIALNTLFAILSGAAGAVILLDYDIIKPIYF